MVSAGYSVSLLCAKKAHQDARAGIQVTGRRLLLGLSPLTPCGITQMRK